MKVLAGLVVAALTLVGCAPSGDYQPRDGDIVFHTSRSAQSLAIQLATKSPYSHMGIVHLRDGKPFVFEAVQPVKLTPLDEWVERGERQQFVAKRLRDSDSRLTAETLRKMRTAGEQHTREVHARDQQDERDDHHQEGQETSDRTLEGAGTTEDGLTRQLMSLFDSGCSAAS